ncbi:MAG: glycosyltransferase family 4 protein [Pyrinomonadaceae bacterium]
MRSNDRIPDLKIVHVIGNFIVGGSAQLVVDLIEGAGDTFRQSVVVPNHPEPLPYQGLDIQQFPISRLKDLHTYLRQESPDIVHIHYFMRDAEKYEELTLWYRAIFDMCADLDLKVIQNVNVPTTPVISPSVRHNVYVSDYVLGNFKPEEGPAASVIYPGSDLDHFTYSEIASESKNIGMVYRLEKDKLSEDSIEVFIRVAQLSPGTRCYIVGGGSLLPHFKERVRQENLDAQFEFTGYVSYSELPRIYTQFSVFVAPIHDESFGQVTPFAMGRGLCVAAYDTGALPEILGSRDAIAPVGDVEALADLVIGLLGDPDRRRSIAKANSERANKLFTRESMVTAYKELYMSLLLAN